MERELLLTGIGGQGVQLAARTLATAAVRDGLEAMVFGSYAGSMRGGATDATVILGTGPILAPPTVDEAWGALVMHHLSWAAIRERLRPGGCVLVDSSVFRGDPAVDGCAVLDVDASDRAAVLGNPRAGSMVALGAFVGATRIVTIEALAEAALEVLPPYRRQHAQANVAALRAGFALVETPLVQAWADDGRTAAA
ncbi:MAG: 2-oxoacid:acceptor oxidoreductase family protein [Gammaproteobacteria bacterium]